MKYVPEKVDLDDDLLLDLKNVFEMFSFKELEGDDVNPVIISLKMIG